MIISRIYIDPYAEIQSRRSLYRNAGMERSEAWIL